MGRMVRLMFFVGILAGGIVFSDSSLARAAEDPVIVEYYYQNGVKYFKRGLYEKAAREFQKTLKLDPSHQEAQEYQKRIGELSGGAAHGKKEVSQEIRSLYLEANEQWRKKDYESAREIYTRILQISPLDHKASVQREKCEKVLLNRNLRQQKIDDKKRQKQEDLDKKARLKQKQLAEKQERQQMKEASRQVTAQRRAEQKERACETQKDYSSGQADAPAVVQESQSESKPDSVPAPPVRQDKKLERQMNKAEKEKVAHDREKARALYLQGLTYYGRGDYAKAIETLQEVVGLGTQGAKAYEVSAKKFIEKAQGKMNLKTQE